MSSAMIIRTAPVSSATAQHYDVLVLQYSLIMSRNPLTALKLLPSTKRLFIRFNKSKTDRNGVRPCPDGEKTT